MPARSVKPTGKINRQEPDNALNHPPEPVLFADLQVFNSDDDTDYQPYAASMFEDSPKRADIRQFIARLPPDEQRELAEELAREYGLLSPAIPHSAPAGPRPRWETRPDEDWNLTPEQFVAKYYAAEKAKVTPRPQWDKDGPDGNRPAEFIAAAYQPEMLAGTLHRGLVQKDLAAKLASWLRSHDLPEGVDIPTKPEWNTRQIEACREAGTPIRPLPAGGNRLHEVERNRRYDARRIR